ncbi:hypothetical protein COOONC_15584, partial [Cooperia oncophora]
MADELARVQQYEYRQNSTNLVLQVDYNLTDRRGREEPTGEVLPLSDRVLKGMKMGDKYMRTKAPIQEQKKKRKKKTEEEDFRLMSKSLFLLSSRKQLVISLVQYLCVEGFADEVLAVLKSDKIREKEKKKEDELDENEGVNVHFDESDEEQDAVIDEIKNVDESSSDDEGGVEAEHNETLRGGGFNE